MKKNNIFFELNYITFTFLIYLTLLIKSLNSTFHFLQFFSKHYRAGQFAFNSNKDMIIEYSYKQNRLFFGLKQNGKPFFKNNGQESYTKEKVINPQEKYRFESQNIFVSLKYESQKEYLLSVCPYDLTELHDLNTEECQTKISQDYFKKGMDSIIFALLTIDNNKDYYIIYISRKDLINNGDIEVAKFSFNQFNLPEIKKYVEITNYIQNRGIDGFIMNNQIIVFYLKNNSGYKYYINIYDLDLNTIVQEINISVGDYEKEEGLFFKGFQIKNEFVAFIYYTSINNNSLELKIGKIINNSFKEMFKKSFNEYKFFYLQLLNYFIKVSDERLAYIGIPSDNNCDFSKFTILLFDLYDNYQFMKIRKYDINLNLNNNYQLNRELIAAVYNGYLVLSFTIIDVNLYARYDDDKRYSIFMMLGYLNGTDREFDINEYFKDDYINSNKNIISNLTENLEIENNIFGYIILDKIKLSIIPDELLFSNQNNSYLILSNESILNKEYILKQNNMKLKSNSYYYLDYQNMLTEPDYITFNSKANNVIDFKLSEKCFIDQDQFYEPKEFYGRQNTLKFKLCHPFCSSCYEYGISNDVQRCITCLPDYQYGFVNDDSSNCVPEEHFYDKKGKLKKCNITNSKYYFNLTSNKKICFSNEYNCPYDYPYFNTSSKECINMTLPTTIPTTISTTIITTIPSTIITEIPTIIPTITPTIYIFPKNLYLNKTKEELLDILPDIIDSIEIGENYNIKGKDFNLVIKPTNSSYLDNSTHVNFKNCENILREKLNIDESSIITFLQLEIYDKNSQSLVNKIEYQVYNDNKTLLDLNICKDTDIEIIHSLKNDSYNFSEYDNFKKDGIDIFDINDAFFNDICHPFSDSKNDLVLEDRIKDVYQNYSICDEGCNYNSIDLENRTISCDCKVKSNLSVEDPSLNIKQFNEIKIESNFGIIKCYNLVFSISGKLSNIGFWIFLILVVAHIPLLFIHFYNGIKPIQKYIHNEMVNYGYIKSKNIIKNKRKGNIRKSKNGKKKPIGHSPPKKIKDNINSPDISSRDKIQLKNDIISNINNNKKNTTKNNALKPIYINNVILLSKSKKRKLKKNNSRDITTLPTQGLDKSKKTKRHNKNKNKTNITKKLIKNAKNNEFNINLININLNHIKEKLIPKNSLHILNIYTFEEAIKYDMRSICPIFYIFLLSKQAVLHAFLFRSPLELFTLRFCLLIFIISSDLSLNAIFYLDDKISKKYRYAKNLFLFTFNNNITIILLSTFIGFIFITLFTNLSNSTNKIREVFRKIEEKIKNDKKFKVTDKIKKDIIKEIQEILKKYKIKVIILLIVEVLLMLFFWYYVTAFCHVYSSTQLSWLLDSALSMLSRLFIELTLSLGFAKLYRIAIEANIRCLYKITLFFYNFG